MVQRMNGQAECANSRKSHHAKQLQMNLKECVANEMWCNQAQLEQIVFDRESDKLATKNTSIGLTPMSFVLGQLGHEHRDANYLGVCSAGQPSEYFAASESDDSVGNARLER